MVAGRRRGAIEVDGGFLPIRVERDGSPRPRRSRRQMTLKRRQSRAMLSKLSQEASVDQCQSRRMRWGREAKGMAGMVEGQREPELKVQAKVRLWSLPVTDQRPDGDHAAPPSFPLRHTLACRHSSPPKHLVFLLLTTTPFQGRRRYSTVCCTFACIMDVPSAAPPRHSRRLVGNSLLYAISVFASLGVFLVRLSSLMSLIERAHHISLTVRI